MTRRQVLIWVQAAAVGLPQTDMETVFVGRNAAGYCGCFNHMRAGVCYYETAEESVTVMSDLHEWARLSP